MIRPRSLLFPFLIFGAAFLLFHISCTTSAPAKEDIRPHVTHLVVDEGATMPEDEIAAFLGQEPTSQLALWHVADDAVSGPPRLLISIPVSYPPPMRQWKQRFRETVTTNLRTFPDSPRNLPASARLEKTPFATAASVEYRLQNHTLSGLRIREVDQPPTHQVILVDVSRSSLPFTQLDQITVGALRRWAQTSHLVPGSTCRLLVIGRARDETLQLWTMTIPEGVLGARARALTRTITTIRGTTDWPLRPNGSAIVEGIHYAAGLLSGFPGRKHLLIVSDLRQVTPGVIHFENHLPARTPYLETLTRSHLIADLSNWTVQAIAHDHQRANGDHFRAEDDVALRALWNELFRAMHCPNAELHRTPETVFPDITSSHQSKGERL